MPPAAAASSVPRATPESRPHRRMDRYEVFNLGFEGRGLRVPRRVLRGFRDFESRGVEFWAF